MRARRGEEQQPVSERRDLGARELRAGSGAAQAGSLTVTTDVLTFTTGTLEGKPVVLFLSGVSMVNASMNTQLALNRFNVNAIVSFGILVLGCLDVWLF